MNLSEDWGPGRWWRVIDTDGDIYCETSNKDEASNALNACPGSRLQRLYERHQTEWRDH